MLECWSCTFVLGTDGGVSALARPGGLFVSGSVTCGSWDTEQTGTFIIHACNTTKGTTHYPTMKAQGFYLFFFSLSLLLLRLQLKIYTATLLNIYWTVRESFWKELLDMCAPLSGFPREPQQQAWEETFFFKEGRHTHINTFCWSAFYGLGGKGNTADRVCTFQRWRSEDCGLCSISMHMWSCC